MEYAKTITVVMLVAAWAVPCAADEEVPLGLVRTEGTLAMPLVAKAPVIDGRLDDAAWEHAQPMKLWSHGGKPAVYGTVGSICRDENRFYFAAWCPDDDMSNLKSEAEPPNLWQNDCVELFIVPEREKLYFAHLMLSCDGKYYVRTFTTDSWREPTVVYPLPVMDVATRHAEDGWAVEASIEAAAFDRDITSDSVWALGFNREKHTSPSEVTAYQGGFNTPGKYPPLYFDDRPVVTDGVGARNVGSAPVEVTATLAAGEKTETHARRIEPGESWQIEWRKALGGLSEGDRFTVTLAADGKELSREAYTVARRELPPPPLAADKVPALQMREDNPLDAPDFFPITAWLQNCNSQAPKLKEIGVNTLVGLAGSWDRASEWFAENDMYMVMPFNPRYADDPSIIAWMHRDEPDNVSPDWAQTWNDYRAWRIGDATRPVFLNLGQGVANERFNVLTPEHYKGYASAADILSFDVYPVTNIGAGAEGHNRLAIVAKGVRRLRRWCDDEKPVWIILETTHIHSPEKPSPSEVRTEAWMSIIHGASGIGYFCHDFTLPRNTSAGLLMDEEMCAALKELNGRITELAPVLNSPTITEGVAVENSLGSRVDVMVKKHEGSTYVFAVNMFNEPEKPTVTVPGVGDAEVRVLGEDRTVQVRGGKLSEPFDPYAVHLYEIAE